MMSEQVIKHGILVLKAATVGDFPGYHLSKKLADRRVFVLYDVLQCVVLFVC